MKNSRNPDNYAVLMYIDRAGSVPKDKAEYWITFGGHAHCQSITGLPVGSFKQRNHKGDF